MKILENSPKSGPFLVNFGQNQPKNRPKWGKMRSQTGQKRSQTGQRRSQSGQSGETVRPQWGNSAVQWWDTAPDPYHGVALGIAPSPVPTTPGTHPPCTTVHTGVTGSATSSGHVHQASSGYSHRTKIPISAKTTTFDTTSDTTVWHHQWHHCFSEFSVSKPF